MSKKILKGDSVLIKGSVVRLEWIVESINGEIATLLYHKLSKEARITDLEKVPPKLRIV